VRLDGPAPPVLLVSVLLLVLVGRVSRRTEELATRSPLGAWAAPRSDTDVSAGPGPASDGPGAGPSLISPACQGAKLENLEGLPGGRLRTTRQL